MSVTNAEMSERLIREAGPLMAGSPQYGPLLQAAATFALAAVLETILAAVEHEIAEAKAAHDA